MAVNIKALADGQLAGAKGTLYTTPSATQTAARVVLVNTGAGARTANVYVKPGATSRRISPVGLSLGVGEQWVSPLLTLEAGDLIEGDASVAAEVDYSIHGFEVA